MIDSKNYSEYMEFKNDPRSVKNGIIFLVKRGFIDDYIFQKRSLKHQKIKIDEKIQEYFPMEDKEMFRQVWWEERRLEQAELKLDWDAITIDMFKEKASDVLIVAEKLKKLASMKL